MPYAIKRASEKTVELSTQYLAALEKEAATKRKRVPAKSVLFEQGCAADAVYYIIQGKVQITVLSKQGREIHQALAGLVAL